MRLKNLTPYAVTAMLIASSLTGVIGQNALQVLPSNVLAKTYLASHEKEMGLITSDYSDFVIDELDQTSEGGLRHLYIQQRYNGIPIEGGLVGIHTDKSGKVGYVTNQFVKNMVSKINLKTPSLAPTTAVNALLSEIGDRKSTRLNSSHVSQSRMPSSA